MNADVVIVGGGPSGLAAAITLRRLGVGHVVVAERDPDVGGIARHSEHNGYGLRDFRRMLTGPAYARRYRALAEAAGVDMRLSTTVVPGGDPTSVRLVSGSGISHVEAGAVILATGCRERSRSARLIAGDRPAGVITTGTLQQIAAFGGPGRGLVGSTAVIIGAEHVSMSAVLTLRHLGCRPVAMITPYRRHQSFGVLARVARPNLMTNATVDRIVGRERVEAVVLADGTVIACDTVVCTGDWIADREWAALAGLDMAPTTGPIVDTGLRTSAPGVFAVGNLVHPAETADVCALDGRHVAVGVTEWLRSGRWERAGVTVDVAAPLSWVSPQLIGTGRAPRGRLLLRTSEDISGRDVIVRQGDTVLWRGKPRGSGLPTRALAIDLDFSARANSCGVLVAVA